VQHAGFTHEGLGDDMDACDVGQFGIEHASEGEQVVALVLPRKRCGELIVRTKRARAVDLGLQLLAPRPRALSKARQGVGQAFALALGCETHRHGTACCPRQPAAHAQALPGVGNHILRLQSLLGGVK
jgi:hypothetical protein